MLWRILLELPLGSTQLISPSIMINLVGTGATGPATYMGIDHVTALPGLYMHCYGKKSSKPGRKMGHMTLLGDDIAQLQQQAHELKKILSVSGGSER
jgi:5-(carboxyamino)imidazole ribonucleotide synthase